MTIIEGFPRPGPNVPYVSSSEYSGLVDYYYDKYMYFVVYLHCVSLFIYIYKDSTTYTMPHRNSLMSNICFGGGGFFCGGL